MQVDDATSIAKLSEGDGYTIIAECPCGHHQQVHTLFFRRQLGQGVSIAKLRQKLRCHKCQARAPEIRVYRNAE